MDIEKVRHIARLSRVPVGEEELERLASEFSEVLEMFERIDSVECEGSMLLPVEPEAKLRDDVVVEFEESLEGDEKGFYKGPRTVE